MDLTEWKLLFGIFMDNDVLRHYGRRLPAKYESISKPTSKPALKAADLDHDPWKLAPPRYWYRMKRIIALKYCTK